MVSLRLNLCVILLLLVTTGVPVQSQVQIPNSCPEVNVVKPFHVERYLGLWFEIEKYPTFFEAGGRCVYAVYSDNHNGTIQVRNTRRLPGSGNFSEIIGVARLVNPAAEEAKLAVIFPSVPGSREAPYWVLATDYQSYAIVYGCSQIGADTSMQFLWYLSRTRNPDASERAHVKTIMENLPVDTQFLTVTDQSNCPNDYTIA